MTLPLSADTWDAWGTGSEQQGVSPARYGDEYGVDVGKAAGLSAGSPVYAPIGGRVLAYQSSSSEWQPGRLVIQGVDGSIVGIGHMANTVKPGDTVTAGQQVGTVGDAGGNSHIEVMFAPPGTNPGTGWVNRAAFIGNTTRDQLMTLASTAVGDTVLSKEPTISLGGGCKSLGDAISDTAWYAGGPFGGTVKWLAQPCVWKKGVAVLAGLALVGAGAFVLLRPQIAQQALKAVT